VAKSPLLAPSAADSRDRSLARLDFLCDDSPDGLDDRTCATSHIAGGSARSLSNCYPFRHKPQELNKPPGIYAPYQPRLDWNLWFASLGEWRDNPMVLRTERRLLSNDADVLELFAGNPFPQGPPRQVRAILWQYWFTSMAEKREHGLWWRRESIGLYAPAIELQPDGRISVTQWPATMPPHE
jgi:hypothetical protein